MFGIYCNVNWGTRKRRISLFGLEYGGLKCGLNEGTQMVYRHVTGEKRDEELIAGLTASLKSKSYVSVARLFL